MNKKIIDGVVADGPDQGAPTYEADEGPLSEEMLKDLKKQASMQFPKGKPIEKKSVF